MSKNEAYSADDLPDGTALRIDWGDGSPGPESDPEAIGAVIGKWEWRSLQKRPEAEWSIDGVDVTVEKNRPASGVMLTLDDDEVVAVNIHLTAEQYRALREHQAVSFTDDSAVPFDVTVVRRE